MLKNRFYTTDEVAALSHRSPRTIRNRVSQGLPPQPIRRHAGPLLFLPAEVDRWLMGEQKPARQEAGT